MNYYKTKENEKFRKNLNCFAHALLCDNLSRSSHEGSVNRRGAYSYKKSCFKVEMLITTI